MKVVHLLQQAVPQAEFAALIGVSEAKVSQMMTEGVLQRGQTCHEWLVAYLARLREQAAGRQSSEVGGLDLVQERAALAREQRKGYALKNAVAEGKFAPIELLVRVLATASQAVVERFDMLLPRLKKVAGELPEAARTELESVVASARNEWIRQTAQLVEQQLADDEEPDEGEPVDAFGPPED